MSEKLYMMSGCSYLVSLPLGCGAGVLIVFWSGCMKFYYLEIVHYTWILCGNVIKQSLGII